MGMNLFDGSDDTEDISKIETNKEFAKRYEHNKKREDLHRLEEMKKKGVIGDSDDSSSESEEEDDDLVDGKKVVKFIDALDKVKKKHPIIHNKNAKLYDSESEGEESEEEEEEVEEKKKKKKKEKPMYLKDVVAKQLIEKGAEFDEEEEEGMKGKSGVKSYKEEQDEIRKAFLNAANKALGDDGDLLKEKKKEGGEEDEGNDEIEKKWDEYFGGDENLDEKEKFLKDFFVNKMWVDKDKGKKLAIDDVDIISEDEEEVEKQEKYEAEFNFRYEEGAGDRILGHSRFTDGSVRKKTNARAVQRKSKEERMAQAEFERKEELKHMKNLKKKEIMEKLEKIRAIAGIGEGGACALNEEDLEEDFDPNEYDRKMKETFDVDYYDDADPVYGNEEGSDDDEIEKPDFDKEDELLGLPEDWDDCGPSDGFAAVREKVLKSKAMMKDDDEMLEDSDQEEEELPEEGKRKRKRKIPLREKIAFDKDLEEYYKLDYEDTIGDLKTRFKYAPVPSKRFRLKPEDILTMDDKVLNQYVPMKKIATYRDDDFNVPKSKYYNLILKNKLNAEGESSKDQKATKSHSSKNHSSKGNSHSGNSVTAVPEDETVQEEKLNVEEGKMSKRSKTRQRQSKNKLPPLPPSRQKAFGLLPTKKSKNKKTD